MRYVMNYPIFPAIEFPKISERSEFINSKIFSDLIEEGHFVLPIDRQELINSEQSFNSVLSNLYRSFKDICEQLHAEAQQSIEYGNQPGDLETVTKSVFKLTRKQYPAFYRYLEPAFRQFLSRLYVDNDALKKLMDHLVSELKKSIKEFDTINKEYQKTGRLKDDISLLLTDGRQKYSAMMAKSKKERLWITPAPILKAGQAIVPNKPDLIEELNRLYTNCIWWPLADDTFNLDEDIMFEEYIGYGD